MEKCLSPAKPGLSDLIYVNREWRMPFGILAWYWNNLK